MKNILAPLVVQVTGIPQFFHKTSDYVVISIKGRQWRTLSSQFSSRCHRIAAVKEITGMIRI